MPITAPLSVLFDFSFNPFALLSLLGILVNLILVYLILSRGPQSNANKWFTLDLCCLVLWGVGEFFSRLSDNPIASSFWTSISVPGYVFMSLAFFSFALAYVGKENFLEGFGRRLLVFGSGILMLFLIWNTNLIVTHSFEHVERVAWGWQTLDANGEILNGDYFIYFIIWLEAFFLFSLFLLVSFFRKVKDSLIKKQTLLIIVALFIPLVVGTFTDALFPIIKISFPGTAILFTSVLGMITTYAILKYKLFVLNPATHFANIIKTMNEAMLVFNNNNELEFENDAAARLFGYQIGELAHHKIDTLIKDKTALNSFDWNFSEKITQDKLVNGFEVDFNSKSGDVIPVSLSGAPLKDSAGTMVGFVMIASDMRELKKLVYNLVAERNKLSITLSGISEGVFVVDKAGIVSFFNQAAEKIFGVKSSQVIGKKADEVFHIEDDEGKIIVEYFFPKEKLSKDMVTFSRNGVRINQPDSRVVYADLIAANIVEGEGVNLGAIVTLHDVSKEKDLEEMKLDFVSMAAHELRTPLTSIRGYLSVLQEEAGKKLKPEQASFLEKAFISSTQLAALVENLLSVSRIERGSLQIQAQPTRWEPLIEETYTNFVPQAVERQVKLSYVKPKETFPLVFVDRFRISEVISNLVSNALNYTPAGGSVEISLEAGEKEIITHVKDTGPGIPESALPKLFTKFFRVSGVLEQGSKGTGLGLYISKAVVDMHKGRIWVESALGKGSIFSFSVPVSEVQELPNQPKYPAGKEMFLRKKGEETEKKVEKKA